MSDNENEDPASQTAEVEFYIIEIDLTGGKPWGFEYKQENAKDEAGEPVKVLRVTQVDPSGKCRRALQQDDLIESLQGRNASDWSVDEVDALLDDGELKELKLEVKRSPDKFDPNQPLEGSDTIQEITSSITAGGDFIEEVGFEKEDEKDEPLPTEAETKPEETQKPERKSSTASVREAEPVPVPVDDHDVVMQTDENEQTPTTNAPLTTQPTEKRAHDEISPSETRRDDEEQDTTARQRQRLDDYDNDRDSKPTERKASVDQTEKQDELKPSEDKEANNVAEGQANREAQQKSPENDEYSSEPLPRFDADNAEAKSTPIIEEPRDDTDVSTPASMDNGLTFDDLIVNNISPVASQAQLNELNENSSATNLLDVGGLSTIEEEKSGAIGNTTINNLNNVNNSPFNSRRESSSTLFDVPNGMPEYERKLSGVEPMFSNQTSRQDSGENLLSVPERKSSVNLPQQFESRSGSADAQQQKRNEEEQVAAAAENNDVQADIAIKVPQVDELVQPLVATIQDEEAEQQVQDVQPSQQNHQQQPQQQQQVDKPWQKRFNTDEGRNEVRNRMKERTQMFQPPQPTNSSSFNRPTTDSPPLVNKKPAAAAPSYTQQQPAVPVKPFLTPNEPPQTTAAAAPPAIPPKFQQTLPPQLEEPSKPATVPSPPSSAYNSPPLQPSQSGGPAAPAPISPPPKPKFNALQSLAPPGSNAQQQFSYSQPPMTAMPTMLQQAPLPPPPLSQRPILPNLSVTTPTDAGDDSGLILSPTKKIYSTSSYYDEGQEQFPTMIEQIKQCRDIASSLTADPNQTSKGASMFAKRMKKAEKWTYGSDASVHESDAAWCTSDEDAGKQRHQSSSLVNGHHKPQSTINGGIGGGADIPLHYYLSPKRVHDGGQIMRDEPTMRMFDETLPEAKSVAQHFENATGRGGEMYHNRQMKADEWTIDENNVKQPPPPPPMKMMQRTVTTTTKTSSSSSGPGGNTLDNLISHVKLIKSPWDAALESPSGSCEAAFQQVQGAGQFNNGPVALSSLPQTKTNLSMNQPPQHQQFAASNNMPAEPQQLVRQRSGSFPQSDVLPYSQLPPPQQVFSSSETTRTTITHHSSSSQNAPGAFGSFPSTNSGQPNQALSPIPSVGTLTPSPTPVAASAYSHRTPTIGGPQPPPRTPVNSVHSHTIFGQQHQQQQLYPPTPSPTPQYPQGVQGAAFARYQSPPATNDVAQRAQQYIAHNQQQQHQQQQVKFWPPPQQQQQNGPPRRNSLVWNPQKHAPGVVDKWNVHSTDEHRRDFANKLRAWSSSRVPDNNTRRVLPMKNNVSYQWNQQQQRQYGSTSPMTRASPNAEMKHYPNNTNLPIIADQYAFIDKPRQQQFASAQPPPQQQQRASRYEQFTAQRQNPQQVPIPIQHFQRQPNFQQQQQRRASLQHDMNNNNYPTHVSSPVPSTTASSSRRMTMTNQQRVYSPQPQPLPQPPLTDHRQFSGGSSTYQPLTRQTSGSISYQNLSNVPYGASAAPVKVDVIRPGFVNGPPPVQQTVRQPPNAWTQPQKQHPVRNALVQQQQQQQQPRWNNAPPQVQQRYQPAQPQQQQPQYQQRTLPRQQQQHQSQRQQWQSTQNINSPHNAFNAPQKQQQRPMVQTRNEQSTYYHGGGGNNAAYHNGVAGQHERGRMTSPSSAAGSMWNSNWELGANRTAGFVSDF